MKGQLAILGASAGACALARRAMRFDVPVRWHGGGAEAVEMDATQAALLPALYDVALPGTGALPSNTAVQEAVSGAALVIVDPGFEAVLANIGEIAPSVTCLKLGPAERGLATLTLSAQPDLCPAAHISGVPDLPTEASNLLFSLGMDLRPEALAEAAGLLAACQGNAKALVAALRALKRQNLGMGATLVAHETAVAPSPAQPGPRIETLRRQVPPDWVDYNDHMNEQFYLTAFSDATDRLLLWAGMDAACVAAGQSIFTVETHIRHLAEVSIGAEIAMQTRVIEGGGKRLHLWHELCAADRLCATGEQLLLHMDLTTRKVVTPPPRISTYLAEATQAQAGLALPDGFGRFVAAPRLSSG